MLRPIARPALLLALSLLASNARAENPVVRFTTILGSYDVELCAEVSALCSGVAPISVANFLAYGDGDRHPPTRFIHRRGGGGSSPLVVQRGGRSIDMEGFANAVTPFDPIALEVGVGLSNLRGTVAMARSTAPGSATSQWFINLVGNVTDEPGPAVVDAIRALPRFNIDSPSTEIPLEDYPLSGPAAPFRVYVSSIERVPKPAAGLGSGFAFGARSTLKLRRA